MENFMIKDVACSHPLSKFPYYHARIKVENNTDTVYYIDKLIANGEGVRDYSIFCKNDFIFEPILKPHMTTDIFVRADWENGKDLKIELELIGEKDHDVVNLEQTVQAPAYGGYWNKDWKYYFSLVATERDGIARVNEPIHHSTSVYLDQIKSPKDEVRVVEIDPVTGSQNEIISQVYGVCEPYTGIQNDSIDHSISFDVAFYANVAANSAKVYLVFYGNDNTKAPQYASNFKITGEAPGLKVENEYYTILLHEKSGVIDKVIPKMGANSLLEHGIETNGALHWNPGFYMPPVPWSHASDWVKLDNYFEEAGPVFLMTQKYSPMHMVEEYADVSQTYLFYANAPYIRTTSILDVKKDAHIQALRNGEIVFNLETITDFAMRDKLGEIKDTVIMDLPRFEEIALTYDADLPWTALYNPDIGVGFAEITINTSNMRRIGGLPRLERHHQYLNWGPWYYITRCLIFPFGSQNPKTMSFVPAKSSYYEDMVFLPFVFEPGAESDERFDAVEKTYQAFANPLNLQEEQKTDHRIPAQFVLGPRMEGEVKETEAKPWPINLDNRYTRFRQSPVLLNELHFKKKDGKYYYR